MTPREKELTFDRIVYLIYQAIVTYDCFPNTGLVVLEIDNTTLTPYPTNLDYLKTVHDLKTKIRE